MKSSMAFVAGALLAAAISYPFGKKHGQKPKNPYDLMKENMGLWSRLGRRAKTGTVSRIEIHRDSRQCDIVIQSGEELMHYASIPLAQADHLAQLLHTTLSDQPAYAFDLHHAPAGTVGMRRAMGDKWSLHFSPQGKNGWLIVVDPDGDESQAA